MGRRSLLSFLQQKKRIGRNSLNGFRDNQVYQLRTEAEGGRFYDPEPGGKGYVMQRMTMGKGAVADPRNSIRYGIISPTICVVLLLILFFSDS